LEIHVKKLLAASAAAALFAAFASTTPARASENRANLANENEVRLVDAPSEVVRYPASQLATIDGAKTLYDRIHSAAWRVCSDMFEANNGPGAIKRVTCVDTLVDAAVKDVNSPRLTSVYEQKTGGRYVPVS
jgi:UrcA family protein